MATHSGGRKLHLIGHNRIFSPEILPFLCKKVFSKESMRVGENCVYMRNEFQSNNTMQGIFRCKKMKREEEKLEKLARNFLFNPF